MHEAVASPLEAWASFYVIVGSSAGALTGLQFVVMTLIAQTGRRGRGETLSAFGTPNVVHFCAALLVASILSVPWGGLRSAGLAVAACGACGSVYAIIVLRRAHRQNEYQPVFEDWLWHTILPPLAYAALLVAGAVLGQDTAQALFVVGGATLLLVFIGIHNAWDTVTYITTSGLADANVPSAAGPTVDSISRDAGEGGVRADPNAKAPPGGV
jgi:hypothetical protein